MKSILAATDFSGDSSNAIHYAAALAHDSGCSLHLVHVYYLPQPTPDAPWMAVDPEELKAGNSHELESLVQHIKKQFGSLQIQTHLCEGYAVEELVGLCKKLKPDMLVVGSGGKNKADEWIFGSTASALLNESPVPLMCVPSASQFSRPAKIGIATDFREVFPNTLSEWLGFAHKQWHSEIMLFHLGKPGELVSTAQAVVGLKDEFNLRAIPHDFFFPQHEDFEAGINHFVEQMGVGVLVMVHHNKTFLERVFRRSYTRQMVFHSQCPLLVFHG